MRRWRHLNCGHTLFYTLVVVPTNDEPGGVRKLPPSFSGDPVCTCRGVLLIDCSFEDISPLRACAMLARYHKTAHNTS